MIWDVPFLGAYDQQDIIGLVEIAANARADSLNVDADKRRRLEDLLSRCHQASDFRQFVHDEPDPMVREWWFPFRYSEWRQFKSLSEGIRFAGLHVLDVGAGTGGDASRLVGAGAHVTALDYNPMLIRRGRGVLPEARWIGGFSHCLPFASATFDAVCCNAALHHMRDVSVALEEMLRVVKPGGWLIATGDPYRPRNTSQNIEYRIFDRHADVLSGINESIPSFSAFEHVLLKYRDSLDIKLLTDMVHGFPLNDGRRVDVQGVRWWDFDKDRERLGSTRGNMGVRCYVKKKINVLQSKQTNSILSAGAYAACLTDYTAALRKLAPHVPKNILDRPFPNSEQTKWELLNGWQAPDGTESRAAYKRARWFLRKPSKARELSFEVRPMTAMSRQARFRIFVNGELAVETGLLQSEWLNISIPLTSIRARKTFVCEIQLHLDNLEGAEFDVLVFRVRRRRFRGGRIFEIAQIIKQLRAGDEALVQGA